MRLTTLSLVFALLAPGAVLAQTPQTPPTPQTTPAAKPGASQPAQKATPSSVAPSEKTDLLDINTATPEQLDALKGIGEKRAAAIIKGRPYKGKDELYQKGIVPKSVYNAIKDQIIAKQK